MNTLSRHIEGILLHHDCVVVPQFGAFITMDTASCRVESEELFFPPLRVVRFNPSLTEDDGLLVDSIRSAQHLSATDAKHQVQRMVLELRQQLLSDGQVDFGTIGVFQQDEDGHVSFEPCQAGAVTPVYFGLDSFSMPRLSTLQRSTLKVVKSAALATEDTDGHITIRLNRRALRYAAATVAAVLIGLLFSSPVTESIRQSQQASLLPVENVETTRPTQTTPQPVKPQKQLQAVTVQAETVQPEAAQPEATQPEVSQPEVAQSAVVQPQATQPEAAQPKPVAAQPKQAAAQPVAVQPKAKVTPTSAFCIVLASDVSLKNAEAFVERLQKQGFEHVRILEKGKLRRVVIDGFDSEEEVRKRNAEIHRLGGDFANSWVLKL